MTIGEINSIIWAKTRHQQEQSDGMDELYQDFMRLKDD